MTGTTDRTARRQQRERLILRDTADESLAAKKIKDYRKLCYETDRDEAAKRAVKPA